MSQPLTQRVSVGAHVDGDGTTHFRVWAPRPQRVALVLEEPQGVRELPLEREDNGYFATSVANVGAGQRYRYRLDDAVVPDVASRWQPDGPFGPSAVVDLGFELIIGATS